MALSLLQLPPEILLQILSNLTITPLLRFAQTSQHSRNLAYTDIQALSLAICPSHRASWHNKLFITQHQPTHNLHAAIQIPQARHFEYPTLLAFHNKLAASILTRHACTLQKLELTLWTLSPPIARALASLPSLTDLHIRLESAHAVPRTHAGVQRKEERGAWDLLASSSSWTARLRALRIANAEVTTAQLLGLVGGAARLRELRLTKCDMLTSSMWDAAALGGLQQLGVTECANVHVSEAAVGVISKLRRLQVRQSWTCLFV